MARSLCYISGYAASHNHPYSLGIEKATVKQVLVSGFDTGSALSAMPQYALKGYHGMVPHIDRSTIPKAFGLEAATLTRQTFEQPNFALPKARHNHFLAFDLIILASPGGGVPHSFSSLSQPRYSPVRNGKTRTLTCPSATLMIAPFSIASACRLMIFCR